MQGPKQGSQLFYGVPITSPGNREGQGLAESYTARNSVQLTKGSPSRIRSPEGKTPNLEPMSSQRSQAKTNVGTEEKPDPRVLEASLGNPLSWETPSHPTQATKSPESILGCGSRVYLIVLDTLHGQLVAVCPQRAAQDDQPVRLLQLEGLWGDKAGRGVADSSPLTAGSQPPPAELRVA